MTECLPGDPLWAEERVKQLEDELNRARKKAAAANERCRLLALTLRVKENDLEEVKCLLQRAADAGFTIWKVVNKPRSYVCKSTYTNDRTEGHGSTPYDALKAWGS